MTTSPPSSSTEDELTARVRAALDDVAERLARAGADPERVRVVAVTKTFGPEAVRAAAGAGITAVGENYVAELEEKRAATRDVAVRWHFLGALQSNKIARALAAADLLCGVARASEIDRIAARRPGAAIYVELDTTGSAQRPGARAAEVPDLVSRARDRGLNVEGLMTVAPPDVDGAREAFRTVTRLADALSLVERSMGMSEDFELAAQWGTTEIRLGRRLFGPRAYPSKP